MQTAGRFFNEQFELSIYALAIFIALSFWFLAIKAPLWLDETASYWGISGGVGQIWNRSIHLDSFPAYFYVLWLTKTLLGGKEIVLRLPSVLAMTASVYVFFRCAKELFAQDVALIATVLFILDSRIVFAAIDVRPYPFAMLFANLAIFTFLRWLKTNKISAAALCGVATASVFYFHYLFGACIVAAFAVAYVANRWRSFLADLGQLGVAVGCFTVFIAPLAPRLWILFRVRNASVFAGPPTFALFLRSLGPGVVPFVFVAVVFVAALIRKLATPDEESIRRLTVSAALALVPTVLLYSLSIATPLHIFIDRYLVVAVPGIALFWAWIFSLIDSRTLRVLGCAAIVTCTAYVYYTSPMARTHGYSWKSALEFADANAVQDGAPLILCSDFPNADFEEMPSGPPSDSELFAPLSYYPVRTTVIPMPRALNGQAQAIGRRFFLRAALNHERFLAACFAPSYPTLNWLVQLTSATHTFHVLGYFDGIAVVEFDPRSTPDGY